MRFKANGVLVALAAALAICALAAASASAASLEYRFEGSGALTEESKLKEDVTFALSGQPTIECTKVKFEKGKLTADATSSTFKSIRFEHCTDTSSPGKCEVPAIVLKELKATLGGEAAAVTDRFQSATGSSLGTYEIKNKGEEQCAAKGKLTITGAFTSTAASYGTPEKEHFLRFNVSGGELKFGEQTASFKGDLGESLQSGDAWSIV